MRQKLVDFLGKLGFVLHPQKSLKLAARNRKNTQKNHPCKKPGGKNPERYGLFCL